MSEFIEALLDPANTFLRCALLAGVLASVACGVVGSYVVVRRITYIAGGIAHCVFGGLGAAYYLGYDPLHGAIVAALIAALIIGWVRLRTRQREDTVISALWAIGMATGVLFIHITPGYGQDLMSYIFGSILFVSPREVWLMAALDVIIVGATLLFYKQFLAVCFDEEFARLRGVNVELYYLLLLCLTALAVVLLVGVVGIVMAIALFTLPVAVAGHFTRTLWRMMILAALLSMVLTSSGLALSYSLNLPAGATTVILAGIVYLVVLLFGRLLRGQRA